MLKRNIQIYFIERSYNMVEQGIGLVTSEFKKMRTRNNYYIDKTMFIKDIIDNKSEVTFITRPLSLIHI